MLSTARKIGNSTGFIINAQDLNSIGIKQGDDVEYTIESGKLVIEKSKRKGAKKYDINELLANTDFEALKADKDLQDWENISPVGKEVF